MSKFRKKPVVIEATQWFKMGDHPAVVLKSDPRRYSDDGVPWVNTLEGGHVVTPGDWIITGIKGEFYPCKPDIFAATYEQADSAAPGGDVEQKGHIAMLKSLRLMYDDGVMGDGDHIGTTSALDAAIAALSASKQVGAGDTREVIHCPACDAPCKATVHGRGGDWGWGTTDEERTTYKYEGYTTAQPAPQPVEAEGREGSNV